QQREAGASLLVADADVALVVERHGSLSLPSVGSADARTATSRASRWSRRAIIAQRASRAMIVPSGNGSLPSRTALIATSLHRMARKSLRLPSSWATEINLQSRYPGGILTPKIGAASPSACPDVGAMEATTPASATTATSTKTIRLIRCLLHTCIEVLP